MTTATAKTIAAYDKIARQYSATHPNPNFWQKEFEIFRQLIKGKKVIDIGCGHGRDAEVFVKNNFDYLGIDASKAMLDEARQRVPNGNFRQMDFYQLDLPEATFDGFWACAALLHIPKRRLPKVLRSIRKIIKPDGVGFMAVKEKRNLEEGIIKQDLGGGIERYFAFYGTAEFQKRLEENGFTVIQNHITPEGDTNWLCYFVSKLPNYSEIGD